MASSKVEQIERGWLKSKGGHRTARWWLKRWLNRARRRDLKKRLDNASTRHTQGYEF